MSSEGEVIPQEIAEELVESWVADIKPHIAERDRRRLSQKISDALVSATGLGRGRFIPCRGCPTVSCTCITPLEDELLTRANDMPERQRGQE